MGLCRAYTDSQIPNIANVTIAVTTAGTSILIASIGTNSIYITDLIISNGAAGGSMLFGIGTGSTAPTGSAIDIQSIYIGANTSIQFNNFGAPIKINTSNNFLVTAVSCTTLSVTACYYVAP
jgi:hypothetical protein